MFNDEEFAPRPQEQEGWLPVGCCLNLLSYLFNLLILLGCNCTAWAQSKTLLEIHAPCPLWLVYPWLSNSPFSKLGRTKSNNKREVLP
jgi:hypothetical protein